jgi:hypothetical protein
MIRRRRSLTGRVLAAALALVFGAVSASAYTIVMRDGRRVAIPDKFTVTNSTVTYEVGGGFQVTMQLNTIDVAATERANNEAKGAFLLRANAPATDVDSAPQKNARRSITNADLEEYRRARVESEKAYERTRRELGLPSLEERRREAAAIQDRTLEQVRVMRQQQELEEAYQRGREDAQRAQVEANNAQMNSWGAFPGFFPVDSAGFGTGFGGSRRFGRLPVSQFPGFLSTPITPFPTLTPRFRRPIFVAPRIRGNPRPVHRGRH